MTARRALVLALAVTAFGARRAAAQRTAPPPAPLPATGAAPAPDTIALPERAGRADDGDRPVPPLVVRADARSARVVRVPVPAALAADSVRFEVVAAGGFRVLGARSGVLAPAPSDDRAVVLSVLTPGGAAAGRQLAVEVVFSGGAERVRVPVEVDVAARRAIRLQLVREALGARPGDRLVLAYRVVNEGNLDDTVLVRFALPGDWRAGDAEQRLVVRMHGTAQGALHVRVARSTPAGIASVGIAASSGGVERARATAAVDVRTPQGDAGLAGVRVATQVATVLSGSDAHPSAASVRMNGPVGDSLQLDATITTAVSRDPVALAALSGVGSVVAYSSAILASPHWSVQGGAVSGSFAPLTGGYGMGGRGLGVAYRDSTFGASVFGARAIGAAGPGDGAAGATVRARVGDSTWVTTSASYLADTRLTSQHLRAFGVGASTPVYARTTLTSELAYRSYDAGAGAGWRVGLHRLGTSDLVDIGWMHAPGGSAAFAQAVDQMTASASRLVTPKLLLSGNAFSTRDANATFNGIRSAGWGLAPRLLLRPGTDLVLTLQSRQMTTESPIGSSGTSELMGGSTLVVRWTGMYSVLGATLSANSRDARFADGSDLRTRYQRATLSGRVGMVLRGGLVELSTLLDQGSGGIGYEARRVDLGLTAASSPVVLGPAELRLRGEVQRYMWAGGLDPVTVLRSGIEARLPNDLTIALGAERNPYLRLADGGSAGWVSSLRVGYGLSLPRFGASRVQGTVFEDVNADGIRQAEEPGVPGVLVSLDGLTTPTDDAGGFRFAPGRRGTARVDARSLPMGWLATPPDTAGAAPRKRADLAVVPTVSAEVRVRTLADSASGYRPELDVRQVYATARDDAGRSWTVPVGQDSVALFDALPPGRYTFGLELGQQREPLRVQAPEPVDLPAGTGKRQVVVDVLPRRVRLFRPRSDAPSAAPTGPVVIPAAPARTSAAPRARAERMLSLASRATSSAARAAEGGRRVAPAAPAPAAPRLAHRVAPRLEWRVPQRRPARDDSRIVLVDTLVHTVIDTSHVTPGAVPTFALGVRWADTSRIVREDTLVLTLVDTARAPRRARARITPDLALGVRWRDTSRIVLTETLVYTSIDTSSAARASALAALAAPSRAAASAPRQVARSVEPRDTLLVAMVRAAPPADPRLGAPAPSGARAAALRMEGDCPECHLAPAPADATALDIILCPSCRVDSTWVGARP